MQCEYVVDHHECAAKRPCGTGRPFLVHDEARVAGVVGDTAWGSDLSPELGELDVGVRALLARHWTRIALMEHASRISLPS